MASHKKPRQILWINAARKDFAKFPSGAQVQLQEALNFAAHGQKAKIAKPMKAFDGVFEIALKYRSDAYRAIYAIKIDTDIWVLHAFQKKSKTGIKTPLTDINLIRERLSRLKERLK